MQSSDPSQTLHLKATQPRKGRKIRILNLESATKAVRLELLLVLQGTGATPSITCEVYFFTDGFAGKVHEYTLGWNLMCLTVLELAARRLCYPPEVEECQIGVHEQHSHGTKLVPHSFASYFLDFDFRLLLWAPSPEESSHPEQDPMFVTFIFHRRDEPRFTGYRGGTILSLECDRQAVIEAGREMLRKCSRLQSRLIKQEETTIQDDDQSLAE